MIIPFGLVLRRSLAETLHHAAPDPAPAAPARAAYTRIAVVGLALMATATTANYLLSYMTTYANSTLGMASQVAFGATAVVGAAGLVFDPLGGLLSDRFGRKQVILIAWLTLARVHISVLLAARAPALGTGAVFRLPRCSPVPRRWPAPPRWWRSPRVCRGTCAPRGFGLIYALVDRGVRRLDAVPRAVVHATDRESAGAGLVHDRRVSSWD